MKEEDEGKFLVFELPSSFFNYLMSYFREQVTSQ